ncbi:MAG TPA: winged helix DNA-binding domain-containing protein [Patescibacteria group bacterium]|nr:winged helix DNA-binding domain-containing protein [Patescibacteria group bacterium]
MRRAPAKDLVSVAGELGGVQAQVASAAELSLAARIDGLSVRDVRRALIETRTLVKTWTLRGTLHYIPAGDVPVFGAAMTGAFSDRIALLERAYGIARADIERLTAAFADVLDATPRTRREIAAAVEHHLPENLRHMLHSGWGSILHPAAYAGILCFGPPHGQNVTFVRVDAWTGRPVTTISRDQAVADLARRFLHVNGPATHADFSRWTGLSPARARGAFLALEGETVQVSAAGRKATLLKSDEKDLAAAAFDGEVRLLPHFDVYTLAQAGRDLMIADAHRPLVYRKAAWISPVIVAEGRIVGTWSMQKGHVALEPFGRLTAATRRAAIADGERLRAAL